MFLHVVYTVLLLAAPHSSLRQPLLSSPPLLSQSDTNLLPTSTNNVAQNVNILQLAIHNNEAIIALKSI